MALIGDQLSCTYDTTSEPVFDGVSIGLSTGQILGLTGPSGAGKSSLARILSGLQAPDDGAVLVDGAPVSTRRGRMTGEVGILHQSARAATNPQMRIGAIIAEPLGRRRRPGAEAMHDVASLTARVGLTPDLLDRYPGQVSDGQLQRACVARALAAGPRYLVCDEPTAMLDAAATAAIAGLLIELAADDVGILAVSHDHLLLDVLCDTVVDLRDLTPHEPAQLRTAHDPAGGPRRTARLAAGHLSGPSVAPVTGNPAAVRAR